QRLDLRGTRVSDAGLKDLAVLKSLQTLRLTEVTDRTLHTLKEVGLLHTLFEARGAAGRPTGPEDVTALDLQWTPRSDAALKSLRTLSLNFSRVTDAGLKELAPLQSLQGLDLGLTRVTDPGLKELAALKSLQSLGLKDTRVTDAGLKELAALKSLRTLELG